MMRALLPAFLALAVLSALMPAARVAAEPYLAVRVGRKCSACHVNRTGGGMRKKEVCKLCRVSTVYNRPDLQEPGEPALPDFTGALNQFVSLGGDFRFSYRHIAIPDQPHLSEFAQPQGQIYLEAQLLPGRVTFYLDQQVLPSAAQAREGFALFGGLFWQGYLKAGKFFLPFGYRLQDETAFVRSAPQFTMANGDNGLELGLEPGPFSLALAVTNGKAGGSEDNAAKQLHFSGSMVGEIARIGVSHARNRDASQDERAASSLFGGMGLGPLALLFEFVSVEDTPAAGAAVEQRALLAEADWEVVDGANLKLSYEWYDPDTGSGADERRRSSLVFEPFLLPQTQVRGGIRVNDSASANPLEKADDFFLELHLYF